MGANLYGGLVFTQFVDMGRLVGRALQDNLSQADFAYYFGSMSQNEKDESLKAFQHEPTVKVLVSRATQLT